MSNYSPPGGAGADRQPKLIWAGIAAAAVVVLLIVLFVTRALAAGEGKAVSAPSGLKANAQAGYVSLSWEKVGGAASYLLIRDGQVAYSGPNTTYDDRVADQTPVNDLQHPGKRKYKVQAVTDNGAVSSTSGEIEVEANRSWGVYSADIQRLPKFFPASPTSTGWEDMSCYVGFGGTSDTIGGDRKGSGQPGMKFAMYCNSGATTKETIQTTFFDNQAAQDANWSRVTTGGQAITWSGGTGMSFSSASRGSIYLKFSDPKYKLITISIVSDEKTILSPSQLMSKANSIPMT